MAPENNRSIGNIKSIFKIREAAAKGKKDERYNNIYLVIQGEYDKFQPERQLSNPN